MRGLHPSNMHTHMYGNVQSIYQACCDLKKQTFLCPERNSMESLDMSNIGLVASCSSPAIMLSGV